MGEKSKVQIITTECQTLFGVLVKMFILHTSTPNSLILSNSSASSISFGTDLHVVLIGVDECSGGDKLKSVKLSYRGEERLQIESKYQSHENLK